ncbi:DUF3168 domain-containing protein [Kaistia geumhonensis]|uniref:DUF3168 domain-containing protein n=1 Tax=Kaistia geumhonensis TaxID=410839 RepID=A0ABU0M678_9HYPH|nr:DUF3168 domain-containing protein [Kaistia geumhonensis]MCX5478452.1 DUF3168 domain-containing protein [Kaistia geumhonensis]MDQ0516330.1 hypothetical protein [Kaistia geumhonensis]
MIGSPSLALQKAIVDALSRGVPEVGGRVFDVVPPSAAFPYVTIGEGQDLADTADCYDGTESFLDIHVWSRAVGFPEAKRIAGKVRHALHDADLPLDEHVLLLLHFRDQRPLRDPDGVTSHVAMTFRALTQPA